MLKEKEIEILEEVAISLNRESIQTIVSRNKAYLFERLVKDMIEDHIPFKLLNEFKAKRDVLDKYIANDFQLIKDLIKMQKVELGMQVQECYSLAQQKDLILSAKDHDDFLTKNYLMTVSTPNDRKIYNYSVQSDIIDAAVDYVYEVDKYVTI